MRTKLIESIRRRTRLEVAPQSPLHRVFREMDFVKAVDTAISVVYLYTRMKRGVNKTVYMAEIISAIGHGIMGQSKLRKDSGIAAKLGGFLLYSFEEFGFIEVLLGQGHSHNAYIVRVDDDEGLQKLWNELPVDSIEKLPSETPYSAWTSVRHPTGAVMIKTGSTKVINAVTQSTHPILFSCINKAQEVGWEVNPTLLEIQKWALRNKAEAFRDIWSQRNVEARKTKMREARAIASIAERFIGKSFYHLYYYDFRGRRYPTTAYLHEQGSDVARGLLRMAEKLPLGQSGVKWLLISAASTWAGDAGREDGLKTDKISLSERAEWAESNMEILLSYADSPKVNQGWMKADKPWQFLAICFELKAMFETPQPEAFMSGLPGFMDGSNNGAQHLTALVRDQLTAPHVNLVPLPYPGDLYLYVAEHAWKEIERIVKTYEPSWIKDANRYIDNLIELKKQLADTEQNSDLRKELIGEIAECRADNEHLADLASPVFWLRITDPKARRKIVKRNVMTLPYGGTAFGLGQQQIDDAKKHGIDLLLYMEHKWGAYLGRLIFENCKQSMAKPMQLLSVFEQAGKVAEQEGRFLSWTVPVTNFPVVQNYTQGVVRKIYVQYGPPKGGKMSTGYYKNTLQVNISFVEETEPSKNKQSQGASPNAIHSLDAAHLALTVDQADFPMVTIHDSYGCHLCNMDKLYHLVRDTFVQLYMTDPLQSLMQDIGGDISKIEYGTLDIDQVRLSEYCFI